MRRAARWPSYRLRRFCRGPEEVGRPPEDYIGYFPWRVCRARALFCLRIVDRGNEAKTKNQLQPSMRSTFSPRCRTCLSISEAISRSSSITARYGSAVKSVSGSIGGYRREDRASDRWSAIYCGWAFLVSTRDRIAPMATQSSDGRLRRRRRSPGYRPCLVRMAVGARAHLGSRRRVSFWSLLRAPRR